MRAVKRFILLPMVLIGFVLSGCSIPTKTDKETKVEQIDDKYYQNSTIKVNHLVVKTADAIEIAQDEFKGHLKKVRFERSDNKWKYIIVQGDKQEEAVTIVDAKTSDVISHSVRDSNEPIDQANYFEFDEARTFEAIQKGARSMIGNHIRGWQLTKEYSTGAVVYRVAYRNAGRNLEAYIDAESGIVLNIQNDAKSF